jgi:hypothetical protein
METRQRTEEAEALRRLADAEMIRATVGDYLERVVETLGAFRTALEESLPAEEREADGTYQGVRALEELACDVYREATED